MKKILVIEDTKFVLRTITMMLKKSGFEVLTAEDGKIGVMKAKEQLPDLILCDIEMPELNGYEVLINLMNDSTTSTIPFIFMTGEKKEKAEIRYGMELGADDYLTKPFTEEELLTSIKSRLGKKEIITKHSEQKLEELRTNIIYALPHEFRTPLSTMLVSSSLIIDKIDRFSKDDIKKIATGIYNSTKRLHKLIENFLLYAQIETLKSNPERVKAIREINLFHLKKIIYPILSAKAEEFDRVPDLFIGEFIDASIKITKEDLEKIISEIIDNALKFSKKGSPIEITNSIDNYSYILNITDYGRGMTADQISNIGAYMQFERKFYEQQGSGLGLIIAKQLIELHSGGLKIESVYGKYTKINLYFKLNQEE